MPGENHSSFRILALDGGGSWAILQVMALKEIFKDASGHEILAHFDLVAANSGGSVVLAGLAEGLPISKIETLFRSEDNRRKIFNPLPWWKKYLHLAALLRWVKIGSRYAAVAKIKGLQEFFPTAGAKTLPNLSDALAKETGHRTHFLIVGCDYESGRAVFFRSNKESRASSFSRHPSPTLAEAVHASTNAPINYFDRAAEFSDSRFWDGAVSGHNNPVLAAVVEALANGVPPSRIAALSLGTGTVRLPMANDDVRPPLAMERQKQSIIADLRKLGTSILDDPPDAATFIAHVALHQALPDHPGHPVGSGCLVRMNPVIRPVKEAGKWQLPKGISQEEFTALAALDLDAVEKAQFDLIDKLGREWLANHVPNQPIRSSHDFTCEIGHATFSEAKQAWEKLKFKGEERSLLNEPGSSNGP